MKFIKKYSLLITLLSLTVLGSSCMKEDRALLKDSFVEFDAATYNANAAGVDYPMLTRVPRYGEPVNTGATTADPAITRTSGTIKFRVNLVGAQRSTPTVVEYGVVADKTTAVSGTHFTTASSVTIPANSSFGEVTVVVLNAGASSVARDLVLELRGASDLPPSQNEKRIGIRISQL